MFTKFINEQAPILEEVKVKEEICEKVTKKLIANKNSLKQIVDNAIRIYDKVNVNNMIVREKIKDSYIQTEVKVTDEDMDYYNYVSLKIRFENEGFNVVILLKVDIKNVKDITVVRIDMSKHNNITYAELLNKVNSIVENGFV